MNERIVIHPPKKDKAGKYYVTVSYYIKGQRKQRRKSGFKKSADAKLAGETIKKELEAEMPVIKMLGSNIPTFREFAVQYMKIMKNEWAANTMKNRKQALAHCDFADKDINKITKMDLSENVLNMEEFYAFNTISSTVSGWSVFLNAAKEYGYIKDVPSHSLKKPANSQKVENVMSVEDGWKYIEMIKDPEVKLFCVIGMTCGTRAGETLDININDIDNATKLWNISHQFQYVGDGYRSTPKLKTANSYRKIPIPPSTIKAINEFPLRTVDGFVFRKAPYHLVVKVNRTLKEIGAPITNHGFRHTYVTNLIRSKKFDIQSIARLAGDTVNTILETYSHYLAEMQDENIKNIGELFG